MKMRQLKSILLTIALTLVPAAIFASGQVVVNVEADSMMLWVGEQTGLHLEVTCDAGQNIEFPLFTDTIVRGLEIIPPMVADTQYVNDGHRMTVTRNYTVTCFDSALVFIPPIPVRVDGNEYESGSLALSFLVFDIPEGSETELFPPKDNMDMPVAFRELSVPILFLVLSAIAIALAVVLLHRYKDNKPIIRKIKVEPKLPAHERALNEIERLRQSGSSHGDDPKAYYTDLTDILREYINDRFGFNATEMTSQEIIDNLTKNGDSQSYSELSGLLSTSDMVKFAKFMPMISENDRNLLGAVEFVKETMLEQAPDEQSQKLEETVVVEKRSKGVRLTLLLSCIALSIAAAVLIVLLVFKLYYLFF